MLSVDVTLCIALYSIKHNAGPDFSAARSDAFLLKPYLGDPLAFQVCLFLANSGLVICAFHFLKVSREFLQIYQPMFLLTT